MAPSTPPDVPKLALNEFTTMPQDFDADIDLCQRVGVEAMELCGAKVSDDPVEGKAQLERLKSSGLGITSYQSRVHSLFPDTMAPEPSDPEARAQLICESMDSIASVLHLPGLPCVVIGGAAPGGNYRRAREAAHTLLPRICDHAEKHGYKVAFEPIHPVLMNQDTFTWSLDGAVEILDAADRKNLGMVCDVWHIFWERDLARRLKSLAERVLVVHLSDYPKQGPRNFTDRAMIGHGAIPFPTILKALYDGNFRGPYCLEILSDTSLPGSLWSKKPEDVIRANIDAFAEQWRRGMSQVSMR